MKRFLSIFLLFTLTSYSSAALSPTAIRNLVVNQKTPSAGQFILPMAEILGGFAKKWSPYVAVGSFLYGLVLADNIGWGGKVNVVPSQTVAPTPLGWADSETPPPTATTIIQYFVNASGLKASPQEACSAYSLTSHSGTCPLAGNYAFGCYNSSNILMACGFSQAQCPPGYSGSTGTCLLSIPSLVQWPSDGKPTYYPGGSTPKVWTPHPRDTSDNTSNPWSGSGQVNGQRIGTDEVGNPVQEDVIADPGGVGSGLKISQKTQGVTSTGDSRVNDQTLLLDGAGRVINVTSQTYDNSTISNINTNATPNDPVDTSNLATEATAQSIKDNTQRMDDKLAAQSVALDAIKDNTKNMDDKLAAQATTLGDIKTGVQAIDDKLATMPSDIADHLLNGEPTPAQEPPPLDPETDDFFDFLHTDQPYDWNASSFLPSLPETTCSYEIHKTIFGHAFDLAPCDDLEPLRIVLGWAFGVLTVFSVINIIFRSAV